MSGYEVEHNIPTNQQNQAPPRRRPDLSTFFSTLDHIDTSGTRQPHNAHAQPMPRDISAAFRNLANAFEMMRGGDEASNSGQGGVDDLLGNLVQSLIESAEHPPSEVQGVSDEFIEQLERVPKKSLKEDMSCPICSNPFLEGKTTMSVREITQC
ncbi:hypothetical protein LTR37_005767 [Vermiconidia calcicola]|uniref:Uncharacterized protein n=1 Tax=Vermiconidia calcicola TaxID=1690605 RepID=A0ACC3NHR5_9PEZI|nr:hypothetical protein LTR37_005767 [Vermiconidia calcicola]